MKPILIASILLPAILAPAQTKPQDPRTAESEIRAVQARRFRAMTEADVTTLERLLSDDLVYTHANGWRQTKAEFLASLRSRELIYHSFASSNFKAKLYGDTILVTGRASGKVRSKGEELNVELLYLEAYVRQDGRWQLAAWESTRSAPAPARPH
jgi:ketosteroid isomerase-like protein